MISKSSTRPFRRRLAGSTIIIGLAIMALATLGVTAWISLISARSVHIEGMEASMERRIATLNAGAATREYLYRNVLTKASADATSFSLPDGTATIDVPALPEPVLGSVTRPGGVVRTGPANGYGYYVDLPVVTTVKIDHDNDTGTATIDTTHTTNCLLKSRSPVLAGDLVSTYIPLLSPAEHTDLRGTLRVYGNTMLWAGDSPHDVEDKVYSQSFSTFTVADPDGTEKVKRLDGTWGPQWNFASVPMTSNDALLTNGYQGTLNAIDPGATQTWSMKNQLLAGSHILIDGATAFDSGRGAVSDGSGTVTITLDDIHLTNVLVGNGTEVIIFEGQTNDADFNNAGLRGAISVIVDQTVAVDDLRDVLFRGRNNRRLVFATKKLVDGQEVDFEFTDADINPVWRLLWVAENARFKREGGQPDGTVHMYGGIATDRKFDWGGDNDKLLAIYRETDPKLAERLAPRMAWVEAYAN